MNVSLLRDFNLDEMLAGSKVCWRDDGEEAIEAFFVNDHVIPVFKSNFLKTSPQCGCFNLKEANDYLRMSPLGWVEEKPVYRGDVLYFRNNDTRDLNVMCNFYGDCYLVAPDGETFDLNKNIDQLTWEKQKIQKRGWMNKYESGISVVYPTKELAELSSRGQVKSVGISWVED